MTPAAILFITSGATGGGAERQLVYLLQLLHRRRFAPTVLTVLSPDSPLRLGDTDFRPEIRGLGIEVVSLDEDRFFSPRAIGRIIRFIRGNDWRLVQTFGLRVDLLARLAKINKKTRLIASIRNTEDHRGGKGFLLDGLTSGAVDLYISNSALAKQAFMARAGIPEEKIVVVPNGIDADEFYSRSTAHNREKLRREWGLGPEDLLAITVANLHRAKGHPDILQAAGLLGPRLPGLKFAFCGSDRLDGRLQLQAQELGLQDRVLFLGHRRDIPAVLQAADIFLLASHWEGMPNAVMEAMAMGLPVVATKVGGVPELAVHAETALLVPPQDPGTLAQALQVMATDQELRQRLGQNGYQRVRQHFSLERMAARTQAVYQSLLDQG